MFGVRPQPELGPGFFDEDHESDKREISPSFSTHQPPSHGTGFFDEEYVSGKRPASPSESEIRRPNLASVLPVFEIGSRVMFCDTKMAKSGSGVITRIIKPGDHGNPYRSLLGALDLDMEVMYELDSGSTAAGWVRESTMWKAWGTTQRNPAYGTLRSK